MTVSYPTQTRNYCVFSPDVLKRTENGSAELQSIRESLQNPQSEDEVVEDLFILNCMLDKGNVDRNEVTSLYSELSRYNQTNSPNIQTYLAGVYRKIKVPDAFGPLIAMLIRNSINPQPDCGFDPNEEIGGAILDYLA